jgi:hypothetical protein
MDQPGPVRRCVVLLSLRVSLSGPCGAFEARAARPRCFGRARRVVARGAVLGGSVCKRAKTNEGKGCGKAWWIFRY